MAWKMMLDREVPEARLEDATEVVLDWFGRENPYFEVRHLVSGLKHMMRLNRLNIEQDARSARARGLVGKSWPESKPLPWPVRDKLKKLRDAERVAAHEAEIEAGSGAPVLEVGRHVD